MPDYDPKSIPILDDIIDNEVDSENTDAEDTAHTKPLSEEENTDIPGTEDVSDDNTPDLFKGDITGFEADRDDNPESDETTTIESALINYQADDIELHDTPTNDAVTLQPEIADQADDQTDDRADDFTPAINLNEIVDDVVEQLIPDLEQQLRFLVRQALEEKLPEEIIQKAVSNDTTRSDD